jgi:hypothetical protein
MVDPHQIATYGFWQCTNNQTGRESIFLNTASNNYLEGTNFNYSCRSLNNPINCMEDFAMPEIKTIYFSDCVHHNINHNLLLLLQ